KKQLTRTTIVAVAMGLLMIGLIGAGAIQFSGKKNAEAVSRGKTLGEALYTVNNDTEYCDPGTKPGHAGASNDEKTSAGIRHIVKTPGKHNANILHHFLILYAPGET